MCVVRLPAFGFFPLSRFLLFLSGHIERSEEDEEEKEIHTTLPSSSSSSSSNNTILFSFHSKSTEVYYFYKENSTNGMFIYISNNDVMNEKIKDNGLNEHVVLSLSRERERWIYISTFPSKSKEWREVI